MGSTFVIITPTLWKLSCR